MLNADALRLGKKRDLSLPFALPCLQRGAAAPPQNRQQPPSQRTHPRPELALRGTNGLTCPSACLGTGAPGGTAPQQWHLFRLKVVVQTQPRWWLDLQSSPEVIISAITRFLKRTCTVPDHRGQCCDKLLRQDTLRTASAPPNFYQGF